MPARTASFVRTALHRIKLRREVLPLLPDAGLSDQVGPVTDCPVCERVMGCPRFAAPALPTAKFILFVFRPALALPDLLGPVHDFFFCRLGHYVLPHIYSMAVAVVRTAWHVSCWRRAVPAYLRISHFRPCFLQNALLLKR